MPDMLVSLYAPAMDDLGGRPGVAGVAIRPVLAPEQRLVIDWVANHFSDNWASEVSVAISRQPAACLVAVRDGELLGFACYDAIARGFFGPTGVIETARGQGIGAALLQQSLLAMKAQGYAYAVIGAPGPSKFYADIAGAVDIPVPGKGIYAGMLRKPHSVPVES